MSLKNRIERMEIRALVSDCQSCRGKMPPSVAYEGEPAKPPNRCPVCGLEGALIRVVYEDAPEKIIN